MGRCPKCVVPHSNSSKIFPTRVCNMGGIFWCSDQTNWCTADRPRIPAGVSTEDLGSCSNNALTEIGVLFFFMKCHVNDVKS